MLALHPDLRIHGPAAVAVGSGGQLLPRPWR